MVENTNLDASEEILNSLQEEPLEGKKTDLKEKKSKNKPMSEEEYAKFLKKNQHISTYKNVGKVGSVNRAIKRGRMTPSGIIMPKRPFNNKKNTCKRKDKTSREANDYKRKIYADVRRRYS